MKKILVLVITLLAAFSLGMETKAATIQSLPGIGKGINIVKSSYASPQTPIFGAEIFNSSFLNDSSLLLEAPQSSIEVSDYAGYSIDLYYSSVSAQYNTDVSVTGTYKLFNGTFATNFSSSISKDDYRKVGQYYFTKSIVKTDKMVYIKDFLGNKDQFKENLSASMINNLDKLETGALTYDEFFDTYGTHFIAQGVLGGRLDINYAVTSSSTSFSSVNKNEVENYVHGGIQYTQERASLSTSYNASALTTISASQLESTYFARAVGGVEFSSFTPGNMSSDYAKWINSVSSSPIIVEYGNNGLVPFWEIIPNRFPKVKAEMQNKFEIYAKSYDAGYVGNSSRVYETKLVRDTTYKINDTGRFKHNKYDVVKYNNWGSGLTKNWLENNGLTHVIINIKLDVYEKDDGVEYIYIYDNKDNKSNTPIAEISFEHGGSTKLSDWRTHTFEFDIPISLLEEGFTIRYGAKGVGNDDWDNKNLHVTLIFY
jgi:hypothetical protein